MKRLLLFCFIHIRYRTINDHLTKTFLYRIDKYINAAKKTVINSTYDNRLSQNKDMRKASIILDFFVQKLHVPDDLSFKEVRDKAFAILDEEKISSVAKVLRGKSCDEKALLWEEFDNMSISIKKNLRPIILALRLNGNSSCLSLIREISLLRTRAVLISISLLSTKELTRILRITKKLLLKRVILFARGWLLQTDPRRKMVTWRSDKMC